MNLAFKTIIYATDTSKNSCAAEETALEIARSNQARLIVVDTVRRPSMVAKFLSSNAEDIFELVATQKQDRLDEYVSGLDKSGISVETRVLVGDSSHEIAKLAIETDADLVVRYKKGMNSRAVGPVGTTARNLMRVCHCPLLLVADDHPIASPNVLACVNAEHDAAENRAIVAESMRFASLASVAVTDEESSETGQKKSGWQLLNCWDFCGNEYMQGYISLELMREYMEDSERNFHRLFDDVLAQNNLSKDDPRVHLQQGTPGELIPAFCQSEAIDVAVLSSVSLNHPLHRLLGSTVESLLDGLPCGLLVVKPIGFVSPIARGDVPIRTVESSQA